MHRYQGLLEPLSEANHSNSRVGPAGQSSREVPFDFESLHHDEPTPVALADVETVAVFGSVWSTHQSAFQFEVSLTESSTTANMVSVTAAQQDNEQSGAGGHRHASSRRDDRN